MGASSLMSLGVRALAANYAALQTVGHNIANANVAGYSRQQVEFQTAEGQFSGAGFFGRGVDVASVARAHDEFLTREAAATMSVSAMEGAREAKLQTLESVFSSGEQGIGHAITTLLTGFDDLAARPGDSAARQAVLARAELLARRFGDAGAQLDGAQRAVTEDLRADVAEINQLTGSIAQINQKISSLRGVGQPPNDLLDERDRLVSRLAQKIQITTVASDDGSLSVFASGGQVLVLGTRTEALGVVADPFDPARSAVAFVGGPTPRLLDAGALGGGTIAGLLRFQNEDLAGARALLGQIAVALTSAVNDQHRLGVDLAGEPGLDLFRAAGAMLQPAALPAPSNAADAGGGVPAAPRVAIADAAALQPREYELYAVANGAATEYRIRRLPDGSGVPVADGDVVDGLRIELGNPPPVAGDRFLLQPLAYAAARVAVELKDPRDVAAASPLTASLAPSNAGTLSITSMSMLSTTADATLTAQIDFGALDPGTGTTPYGWSLLDSGGNVVASGSGSWRAGDPVPAPPDADINGFALQLAGAPASGDRVIVQAGAFPAAQNGNAQALAALAGRGLVGRTETVAGGQTIVNALTFTEAYASALADIGVRVAGARTNAGIARATALAAEERRNRASGVNLDEEAARLIQFQQSYQAAAKVLQIAQSVFDKLLEVAGG